MPAAIWHNTPSRIPEAVRRLIRDNKSRYRSIFVLYGDCGSGLLDKVLAEGVERIAGRIATSLTGRALRQDGGGGSHHVLPHRLSVGISTS